MSVYTDTLITPPRVFLWVNADATVIVHRGGTFKTKVGAEWRTGQESPCLCTLKPEYMRNPDWQQGITLFTVTDKISRIYPVEFSGQFAQFAKMNFKA